MAEILCFLTPRESGYLIRGGGDKRAVTELSFAHVTTKTSEASETSEKYVVNKKCPPKPIHFLKKTMENHFLLFFFII